ncbi:MAG: hypothetical protein WCW16_00360 [Candidatus Magasanikbacteria bacterium]
MTENNFSRPTFLKPEIKLEAGYTDPENDEKHFYHGNFVVVADLKNIPKEIREKIPGGYILKQYQSEEYSPNWNELFEADKEVNTNTAEKKGTWVIIDAFEDAFNKFGRRPTVNEVLTLISDDKKSEMAIDENFIVQTLKKYSLETKARKLKKRYEEIKNVFSDELPNIILPTQFIIGAEENRQHPDRDGAKRLYELQPKINALKLRGTRPVHEYLHTGGNPGKNFLYDSPHVPIPENIINIVKMWAKQIKETFPKQCAQIKEELEKFIELARPIPEKMNEIPHDMVHPVNVGFTADGIRIFDINLVLPNLDKDDKRRKTLFNPDIWLARYNRLLDIWKIVYDEL